MEFLTFAAILLASTSITIHAYQAFHAPVRTSEKEDSGGGCPHVWGMWELDENLVKETKHNNDYTLYGRDQVTYYQRLTRKCEICGDIQSKRVNL